MTNYINTLIANGVVTIPIPPEIISQFNREEFLNDQREFKVSNASTMFVLGSFGALGNPSSQHQPQIRSLRKNVYNYMRPLFAEAFQGKYLEAIPDRFSIRNQDLPVTAESWHKDNSADIGPDDIIFGGYLNLDERQTQYFSCIPGSHMETDCGEGFAKITKERTQELNARRQLIEVPPNHIILFNEKTTHEIARRKIKEPKSYRQYFKWRISAEPVSTLGRDAIMNSVKNQGIFPLHAIGKTPNPPMYGKMHQIHWGDRIEEFSKNIKESFMNSPNKKGQIFVQRFMISLTKAGIPLFPEYTEDEIAILFPQLLE